eukprot:CAMPEP_0183749982 /NCGR_PEP_ID=MMETSP0739-20130205/727_1 /TAXON_ID=385413 /ORGANISM="Thalassiosira miniscula, Strain CCMP1093" /LENGTH=1043 /DNA_ID=CAMNT_0025985887 /DNA_START=14 /DNA_END=3145 /DNA_ORIENTATION=+
MTMAKNKKKRRTNPPSRKGVKASKAVAKDTEDDHGDDHSDDDVPTSRTWSSIPGTRLDVDIATTDDGIHHSSQTSKSKKKQNRKRPHPSKHLSISNDNINASDDDNPNDGENSDDQFHSDKWKSSHYDSDEDDNFQHHDDDEAERDLFDPEPDARTNKFDAGSKLEGANDAGMFLSLEVIPADAYRVEKSGDETSGFVTKVVFTKDDDPASQKKSSKKDGSSNQKNQGKAKAKGDAKTKPEDNISKEKEAPALSKKERQKLKRKAKREAAKERKRLKKEQEDKEGSASSSSASTAKKSSQESKPLDAEKDNDATTPPSNNDGNNDEATQLAIEQLQTTWSISALGVTLHPTLSAGLHSLNYAHPTPIQSATLPAAILGRRDIVGAAPTGSGKTLSYGLPILQCLLDERDAASAASDEENDRQSSSPQQQQPLQALILTPTRELAIQVTKELQRVCCNAIKIGTIVGGFAEVKQRRTLEKMRPPILVGTPGRLWELMSSKEYTHLNNLTQLRFLIIDEADRLIKQGSFPQLQQIFDVINRANPPPPEEDSEDESESDDEDEDRLESLRGVRGEARVVMLDDSILAAIEKERNKGLGGKGNVPKPMEMDDDEFEEQQQELLMNTEDSDNEDEEEEIPPVHRQTFVYSATLTLPPSMHHLIKKDHAMKNKMSKKKKKGKGKQPMTVDGAIAEILDVAGARGETKIVDLSNTTAPNKASGTNKKDADKEDGKKSKKNKSSSEGLVTRLPAGLSLGEIRCAQRHKDSHLYAYLVTTRQGSSGPSLVFCNSIAAVRRVGDTLKTLGLPVKMLHAQMQQKARLGALESLRKSNSRSIVVASDVAARGLDIPSVTTVIHYDVARVVDTFIHRAGRTARGVGEKAVGTSVSLVAPAEEREHHTICESVLGTGSKSLESMHIDGRLLSEAQERVALATKIVSCNDVESQANRKNKWLQDAARDAGLEVDEDMMESGLLDGDQRDRQRFLEAKRAKAELRQLLAKPMRKQHFGKFLSGVGLRESIKSENEVKPFVVKKSVSKGKHKRKKVARKK